jgi:type VI protein secretion system component Hcp
MTHTSFRPQLEALECRLALSTTALPAHPSPSTSDFTERASIYSYGPGTEQSDTGGSSSSGTAGAGVTPFSITKTIDKSSPLLFPQATAGADLKNPDGPAAWWLQSYDAKKVVVQTLSGSHADSTPSESVTFNYGGLTLTDGPSLI